MSVFDRRDKHVNICFSGKPHAFSLELYVSRRENMRKRRRISRGVLVLTKQLECGRIRLTF